MNLLNDKNEESEFDPDRKDRECQGGGVGTSIKQKTLNIAQNAAIEAAAAKDAQMQAGAEACIQIKLQLAERAEEAAKTAEAAYLGKLTIVEELEKELREAREVALKEQATLVEDKRTLEAALRAQAAGQNTLKVLEQAVPLEHDILQHGAQAVKGAQLDVAEKEKLIDEAKVQIEEILRQLKIAEDELSSTKAAAERAISAAKAAKVNAETIHPMKKTN
ncbi:hypothetical protein FQR65_LT02913 [Abscondita terminalis]|nr:hypothetical protein FQR65_LT02913 [Abscondita terminalis]